MLANRRMLKLAVGAVLFATFLFGLMAAPGFLSNVDSTVPTARAQMDAGR